MRQKLLYFLITLCGVTALISGYLLYVDDPPQTIDSQAYSNKQNHNTDQQETKITELNAVSKPITNHQGEDNKKIKATNSITEPPDTPTTTTTNPEEIFETKITLQINGKSLPIPYQDNMSAESAMKEAHSRYPESFWYESIEYGGDLGTFVKSINGVGENYKEKMHWILYINGKKSNKGISTLILNPDDIIMWNYEKEIL